MRSFALSIVLVIAGCASEMPIPTVFTSELPHELPDTAGWEPIIEGLSEEVLRNAQRSVATGDNPIATLIVVEGVCPDSNAPCPITMRYYSASRLDVEARTMDWIVRWAFFRGRKSVEGISYMRRHGDGPYVRTFWIRQNDAWERFEEDAPVAVPLAQLTQDVLGYMRFIESRKPR